jgi:hypothetical protein
LLTVAGSDTIPSTINIETNISSPRIRNVPLPFDLLEEFRRLPITHYQEIDIASVVEDSWVRDADSMAGRVQTAAVEMSVHLLVAVIAQE